MRGERSISRHVFTGYTLVILLLGLTWAASSYSMSRIDARVTHIAGVSDELLANVNARTKLLDDEETGLRGYLLTGQRQFLQPYARARRSLPRLRAQGEVEAHAVPGTGTLLAAMQNRAVAWERWAAEELRLSQHDPRSAATVARQVTGKRLFDAFRRASSRVSATIASSRLVDVRQSHEIAIALNRFIGGMFLVAALITIVVGLLTLRALTRPVKLLSRAADAIGAGNLRDPVPTTKTRELADLERHMDEMRARLAEDVSRRAAIIDVQQHVSSVRLDPEAVMKTITERAQALTGASAAIVEMVEGEDMVYRAATGTAAEHVGLRLARGTSLSGECSRSGEVLYCRDAETDDRVDRAACRLMGARSMVLVPLRQAEEIRGVLKVLSPHPHAFTEADIETLQVVAGVLGAALGHAAAFDALQASERALQATTREQESFIYTVSHDLRAPLVSLQGLVSILSDDYAAVLDEDGRRYLDRIAANASRMQALLSELLDLARIGRIETEQSAVDTGAVVADVVAELGHTLAARCAEVRVDAPLPTVLGNPVRLSQLFTNLIDNAVHYTPPERNPVIHIGAGDRGDAWEIVVADNGIGIPEPLQDRVFALFQRLPAGKGLNPEGTGAGLAIVARVVETHGGRIWLESTDEGTSFHFTLLKPESSAGTHGQGSMRTGMGDEAA